MISTRSAGLLIDTVVCLTLAKWETVSGRFGGYLSNPLQRSDRTEEVLTPKKRADPAFPLGNLLRYPNWLLGSGFCRSRCWLGYHDWIGNRLRNIDGFRAGLMSTNHAESP